MVHGPNMSIVTNCDFWSVSYKKHFCEKLITNSLIKLQSLPIQAIYLENQDWFNFKGLHEIFSHILLIKSLMQV